MPEEKRTQFEILLVEDNEDDATWAIGALAREGVRCNVRRAEDGEEALAILYKKGKHADAPTPALMLLDLSLPKKGGLEVLSEIRKSDNPDLKILPVVIMTVSADFGDAKEALNLRVASYMNKPVRLEDLIAAVKRILPAPDLSDKQRKDLEAWAREVERFA